MDESERLILIDLVALIGGFLISLATSAMLGPAKAALLPGGSIGFGLSMGFLWLPKSSKSPGIFMLSTGLAGFLGYLIFCILFV